MDQRFVQVLCTKSLILHSGRLQHFSLLPLASRMIIISKFTIPQQSTQQAVESLEM